MHWCMDEQLALLNLIVMIPFAGPWLRGKFNKVFRKQHCCKPEHKEV